MVSPPPAEGCRDVYPPSRGAEVASGIALSDKLGLPRSPKKIKKKWKKRAEERVRGESFEGKEEEREE